MDCLCAGRRSSTRITGSPTTFGEKLWDAVTNARLTISMNTTVSLILLYETELICFVRAATASQLNESVSPKYVQRCYFPQRSNLHKSSYHLTQYNTAEFRIPIQKKVFFSKHNPRILRFSEVETRRKKLNTMYTTQKL